MAAAANRNKQIIFSRKVHGTNYVCDICTSRDQAGLLVDHPVVHLAGLIIILVAGLDQSPAQVPLKIGNGIFVEHDEVSLKQSSGQPVERQHFH